MYIQIGSLIIVDDSETELCFLTLITKYNKNNVSDEDHPAFFRKWEI